MRCEGGPITGKALAPQHTGEWVNNRSRFESYTEMYTGEKRDSKLFVWKGTVDLEALKDGANGPD